MPKKSAPKAKIRDIHHKTVYVKNEMIDKVAILMASAFGLVAALAWNDAIKSLFAQGGPLHFIAGTGPWIYAITVTIIAVIMTIWIGKAAEKVK